MKWIQVQLQTGDKTDDDATSVYLRTSQMFPR